MITARELAQQPKPKRGVTPMPSVRNAALIAAREKHGLEQTQVAHALGMTPHTLQVMETKSQCTSLITAFKVARFYECSIEELFGAVVGRT